MLEARLIRTMRLNVDNKVANPKTKTRSSKMLKHWVYLWGTVESVIILCGFVTVSNRFHITQSFDYF